MAVKYTANNMSLTFRLVFLVNVTEYTTSHIFFFVLYYIYESASKICDTS